MKSVDGNNGAYLRFEYATVETYGTATRPLCGTATELGVGVAGGPVGSRWAGRFRIFRYEIRRWHDGVIPDVAEPIESPRRLSRDQGSARWLLDLVPSVPTPVWVLTRLVPARCGTPTL